MVGETIYRYRAQDRLSLSIYLGFSLLESERLLPPPDALTAAMAALTPYETLGLGLDQGLPKPRGEFLAAAQAWAPTGAEERAVTVSFEVGRLRRDFLVLGAQTAGSLKPGPPAPFQSLPLAWAHTAHDPVWNPAGLKPGSASEPGGPPLWGPRVTEADHDRTGRLTQASWSPQGPASPLPLPAVPGRLKDLGSYDQAWLVQASPGLPADFNWSFANLAQPAQRLPTGYFQGDERIRVANAHPIHHVFDVKLPGYRPEVALWPSQASQPGEYWALQPVLDTIWLFPDSAAGLMIWRAQAQVRDFLASNLGEILVTLAPPRAEPWSALPALAAAREGDWPAVPLAATTPDLVSPWTPEEPEPPAKPAAPDQASDPSWGAPDLPGPASPGANLTALTALTAPTVAAATGAAVSPQAQVAALMADSRQTLIESLPAVNQTLREAGLAELTPESLEPYLAREEKRLTQALSQVATQRPHQPQDELTASFRALGLEPARAAGLAQAVDLPLPEAAAFPSPAAFEAAMNEYGQKWASLMGLPAAAGLAQAQKMTALSQILPNPTPQALSAITGLPPTTLSQLGLGQSQPADLLGPAQAEAVQAEFAQALKGLGLSPEASSQMLATLTEYEMALEREPGFNLAQREKLTLGLGQKMEAALNLAPGQITSLTQKNFQLIRQTFYGSDELGSSLTALAGVWPELARTRPALDQIRLDPALRLNSLQEIGQAAGLVDPELLAKLSQLDPWNEAPPAPPEPERAAAPPRPARESPKTLWEPGPSQIFLTRAEVELALHGAEFRAQPTWAAIWPGATLVDLNLRDLDFSGLDLRGADFSGSDLQGASLAGANCQRAAFEGANLTGCHLTGAQLAKAKMGSVKCQGQDLRSVSLTEADLTEADLTETSLAGALADGANFAGAIVSGQFQGAALRAARFSDNNLDGADFSGAILDWAWLERVSLRRARLTEVAMRETTFSEVVAVRADFQGAHGRGARFLPGCDLSQADFRSASLREANFQGTILTGINLSGARATGLRAEFLSLAGARLQGADLRGASFFGSDLSRADLTGSNLLGAILGASDLRGANLADCSLYGADLYQSRLDQSSILTGADLNNTCLKIESAGLKAV
jgi:uncharacterized protein YjbI with pentapeptide repeats